jgi:hypothetical protein
VLGTLPTFVNGRLPQIAQTAVLSAADKTVIKKIYAVISREASTTNGLCGRGVSAEYCPESEEANRRRMKSTLRSGQIWFEVDPHAPLSLSLSNFPRSCSMEDADDSDVLLCLTEVLMRHERGLGKARAEVQRLLLVEACRVAMRSRHYLTVECLDPPSTSAWMTLYTTGSDMNFLNVTSLTR